MTGFPERETTRYEHSISVRHWVTLLIGAVFGLGFLILALRGVSWVTVRASLAHIRLGWLSLAVISVFLVALVKAERWRWLFFPHHNSIPIKDVLSILVLGQVVNILLPIRLGEILRVGMLFQSTAFGLAVVIGTVLVEKLVDFLVIGSLALILGSALITLTGHIGVSALVVLVALTALVGLVLVLNRRRTVTIWFERALGRWSSGRWLVRKVDGLLSGFDILQDREAWQALAGWTALVWILSAATIILTLRAFDLAVPLIAALLIVVIINLGFVLPAAPGLIGMIQYVSVLVLTRYGVDPSVAFSYGLALHLILVLPLILLALWALFHIRCIGMMGDSSNLVIEDETTTQVA
jgi:uncharacterized protein (TIRG00374 family)